MKQKDTSPLNKLKQAKQKHPMIIKMLSIVTIAFLIKRFLKKINRKQSKAYGFITESSFSL
ncbi:hypothetical protein [Enterococcus gilvus]|uniref:hypothetical protein n=1 Tax=Enterococcus gilvus TaxID=160453 RepID=UPI001C8B67DC|nr:hypothetical protein [Enterococcus gilvus]MBX8936867.1 hypothetical protein [Enterococcus gilvus]